MYGLSQAPRTLFEKLKKELVERGFKKSDHDPCLFTKKSMICGVYVDDTIICGPNGDATEGKSMG